MSAAAATDASAPAAKGGKKKLIIIIAAVLLLVVVGGVAALMLMKKKHSGDEDAEGEAPAKAQAAAKRDPKAVPAYLPLDVFTVNLADREAERYAQIGITLELADAKEAEAIKNFMPAIRNNILMVLAHKTSAELLEKEGKLKLAEQVKRAASRAIGVDVPDEEPAAEEEAEGAKKPKKKAKKKPEVVLPVLAVHFSNFIVQ